MKRTEKYLIYLLIILSLIFAIYPINQPPVESFTELAVWSGLSAKNFIKYGFFQLKFLPFIGPVTNINNPGNPYLNHPPLFFWLITLGVWLSNSNYWGLRIIPLVSSLGSLLVLFKTIRLINKKLSLVTLVFFVSIPMYFIYATFPFYGNVLLFFTLFAYYFAVKFTATRSHLYLLLILLFLFLASFTDYPGLFAASGIAVFFFLEKVEKKYILSLLAGPILSLLLWFLLIRFFKPGGFTNLRTGFLTWNLLPNLNSLSSFFIVLFKRLIAYFAPIYLFLFLIFIRRFQRKKTFYLALSLLIFGLLNIVVFPSGAIFHPDTFYFLLPGFALSASLGYSAFKSSQTRALILIGIIVIVLIAGFTNMLKFLRYKWHKETIDVVDNLTKPTESIYTSEFKLIGLLTYRYDKVATYIPQNKWREIKEGLYVTECFSNCSDPFSTNAANLSYIYRIKEGKVEKITQVSQERNIVDDNPILLNLLRFLTR